MERLMFPQIVHDLLVLIQILVIASADLCYVNKEVANCSDRGLTSVPSTLPENITTLLMTRNKVVDIEGFAFKQYANLKNLDLTNNKIKTLNNHSFSGLGCLESLNLEYNFLNLSHNAYPALCFLGLVSLQRLLIGNNVALEWFLNPRGLCNYPDKAIGQLQELQELSVDGLPNGVFGLGFSRLRHLKRICSITFFLSITVLGLIYRYRWRITYFYYMVRDRYNLLRHQDDVERQFISDAFISYASEDRDFIDTLCNNLEGQGKRLVVHHRDFRPGEPIGANIVKSVQTSRHTVLILSGSFLASHWCRYEFEMARMEAVYDSRSVLIVVKIEDVSAADVPRELLYLMRSDSYLEYPDNAEDQVIFWVKLGEAISN
ncbi:toll-like receptor 2 [Haliotis rubra]|uniref:toll-like receptor 2 n=1 Tax=Haliotis rubra TaxID=36100 RepID=UPI001EE63535|nr:toll-like receptor 2 [Haliotis rubra]